MSTRATDALILCGGYNRRLEAVLPAGLPKVLADIDGQPFLRHLVEYLAPYKFAITLCAGHGAQRLREYLTTWPDHGLLVSDEGEPKGTYRAVLRVAANLNNMLSDPFLVLNGDTFCPINYPDLLRQHAAGKFLLTVSTDMRDVPTGVFAVSRSLLFLHPAPALGLNLEDFISRVRRDYSAQVASYVSQAPWYDIGTPNGLTRFQERTRVLSASYT
jgi:NDP-sugar pyrophosphorylase family protein